MNNTFWTLIDNEYYRVHNKILRHAPLNAETNLIESSQESKVVKITPKLLEKVNTILGCSFLLDDFKYD